jgi:leucyl/phenylalanyl-tRNA--protein transferase
MIPIATLLGGYQTGYFPMAVDDGLRWFSPGRRGVIPLETFRVHRRLARLVRQGQFRCTVNHAFRDVITACASRADDSGNWIDREILESYCALHRVGHAHSVELWDADRLVGGLYGVSLRGAFFGESMFHHVRDTSKVALVFLVERLRARGFALLDIQLVTPHLRQFGAIEISRARYLAALSESLQLDCVFAEPEETDRTISETHTPDGSGSAPGSSSGHAQAARLGPSSGS